MKQQSRESRILLPREPVVSSFGSIQSFDSTVDYGSRHKAPKFDAGSDGQAKKAKAPPKAEAEWERIKAPFRQLYIEQDAELAEVMTSLEKDYHFRAT